MTLTSQQETALYVIRVLLRKSPADAARVVASLTPAEIDEVCEIALHLSSLREQLRQMLGKQQ